MPHIEFGFDWLSGLREDDVIYTCIVYINIYRLLGPSVVRVNLLKQILFIRNCLGNEANTCYTCSLLNLRLPITRKP